MAYPPTNFDGQYDIDVCRAMRNKLVWLCVQYAVSKCVCHKHIGFMTAQPR